MRAVIAPAIAVLAAAGVAACGGSSSSSSSSSGGGSSSSGGSSQSSIPLKPGENPANQTLKNGKKGGVLTAYSSEDFEHLDPGESYFVQDYLVEYATGRPLFSYPPNSQDTVQPDLATEIPTTSNGGITDGGKTVTVHIKHGVKFSPPVNREVTSADVAYAIERAANPNVGNAYFPAYFGSGAPAPIVGTEKASYKGGPVPGIQTPDKYTIVFHTAKPSG
jgi:peptide/nickel transport system substrate-binding protein